jgi:putative ABC transport system ATP-binding protein
MSETIIVGRKLSRHFQLGGQTVRALNSVNIEILSGQLTVIIGASGSGKSTLLYALSGLDTPSSGQVWVAGHRLDHMNQKALARLRNQMIGFVFQAFYLVPTMTALENVMLSGVFAHHPKEQRIRRARQLLKILQLADRMQHRPMELSGGQQQRVAIARALYNDPPIIVADEPTGALDSKTGTQVMKMLRQLADKEGKTILIVSHDPLVSQYADRVIRLKDGQIIEDKLKTRLNNESISETPAIIPAHDELYG